MKLFMHRRFYFFLSLTIPCFFILMLEIGTRYYASLLKYCPHVDSSSETRHLNGFFKRHPHPGVEAILCADMEILLLGKTLTTNSKGFRAPEFTKTKSKGAYRVAGIGDSVQMGWGVGDEENYLSQALDGLKRSNVEVLNFSTAGHSAFNHYFMLKEIVLDYRPDLIVLSYVGNDWESFPESPPKIWSKTPSYFINYMLYLLLAQNEDQSPSWAGRFSPIDEIPYDLIDAYKMIEKLATKANIPVVLVMDSRYQSPIATHEAVESLAKSLDFEVVNTYQEFRDRSYLSVKEATDPGTPHNKRYIIKGDGHPNLQWHRDVAALLAERLDKLISK